MKLKTIKYLGLALTAAAGLTTAANAQIEYQWVSDATPPNTPGISVSGDIIVTAGVITGTFTENDIANGTTLSINNWSFVTAIPLGDGDLSLWGTAYGTILPSGDPASLMWNMGIGGVYSPGPTPSLLENIVNDNSTIYGDWVAVPEPTTLMSGMLLLLPFSASTLRIMRKSRAA
jgi:hypothetical protein